MGKRFDHHTRQVTYNGARSNIQRVDEEVVGVHVVKAALVVVVVAGAGAGAVEDAMVEIWCLSTCDRFAPMTISYHTVSR